MKASAAWPSSPPPEALPPSMPPSSPPSASPSSSSAPSSSAPSSSPPPASPSSSSAPSSSPPPASPPSSFLLRLSLRSLDGSFLAEPSSFSVPSSPASCVLSSPYSYLISLLCISSREPLIDSNCLPDGENLKRVRLFSKFDKILLYQNLIRYTKRSYILALDKRPFSARGKSWRAARPY